MKKILYGTFALSLLVWIISLIITPHPEWNVWVIRKELINMTGIFSFSFMSLIMLLAVRPKWLEKYFGGLDKMYYIHKWAGIWAISMGGIHYLIDISGPNLLINFFERPVRAAGSGTVSFLSQNRGLAESMGEWVFWFFIVSLLLTLWSKFSYKIWRYSHKLMPIAFLLLIFHVVILSPVSYWTQPAGVLIGICCLVGFACALLSLFGLIGKSSTFKGIVKEIDFPGKGIINVTCQLEGNWQHKAGQYVFFKHDKWEGSHPFTISSANHGNNEIRLSIKDLGDYTRFLQTCLKVGDSISVEGPYGCFDFKKSKNNHQIWIAGGIGITPFIAWLESLQDDPDKEKYRAHLYYSIRNDEEAGFVPHLEALCQNLPNVKFHVQYTDEMGFLTANQLNIEKNDQNVCSDIWFCGPSGFAEVLKTDLIKREYPINRFHQEIFQMR